MPFLEVLAQAGNYMLRGDMIKLCNSAASSLPSPDSTTCVEPMDKHGHQLKSIGWFENWFSSSTKAVLQSAWWLFSEESWGWGWGWKWAPPWCCPSATYSLSSSGQYLSTAYLSYSPWDVVLVEQSLINHNWPRFVCGLTAPVGRVDGLRNCISSTTLWLSSMNNYHSLLNSVGTVLPQFFYLPLKLLNSGC